MVIKFNGESILTLVSGWIGVSKKAMQWCASGTYFVHSSYDPNQARFPTRIPLEGLPVASKSEKNNESNIILLIIN